MIKLVVLDVDGTSIDRDNHFYDDDIKEIDFYKEKGYRVYVCIWKRYEYDA